MRIAVNRSKCTGCRLCELVCSLFHLEIINPEKSAIRIQKDDLDTSMNRPLVCRQCKEMKCLDGEDVTEESERKQFVWSKERAERCPFNGLNIFDEDAYHCDLCGGHHQCIRVCTTDAIHIKK